MTASLPPLPPLPPPNARLPVQARRKSGPWLSFIIHLILALIVVQATRNHDWWDSPVSQVGPPDQVGGGGGGRAVTMIALPESRPIKQPVPKVPPPPPPPVPVPVVTPVQVPPPVLQPPVDTLPRATTGAPVTTATGGGLGGTAGTGSGPGSGPGRGPGTGGTGTARPDSTRTAARDPEPRQLILIPFDYPPSMRGLTIQVTFSVSADGRVDRVLFSDELPDRGYAKRLETVMRAYRFRPARSAEGQAVPGHTTISVTF